VSTHALDERQITAFASEFYRHQADRSAIADLYGILVEANCPSWTYFAVARRLLRVTPQHGRGLRSGDPEHRKGVPNGQSAALALKESPLSPTSRCQ